MTEPPSGYAVRWGRVVALLVVLFGAFLPLGYYRASVGAHRLHPAVWALLSAAVFTTGAFEIASQEQASRLGALCRITLMKRTHV